MEKIEKSDEQWRAELDPERYAVLRRQATEPPFTGAYTHEKATGMYHCGGCGAPLFSSETKFDSGSGWPSFTEPAVAEAVELRTDAHEKLRVHGLAIAEPGLHGGAPRERPPARLGAAQPDRDGRGVCELRCARRGDLGVGEQPDQVRQVTVEGLGLGPGAVPFQEVAAIGDLRVGECLGACLESGDPRRVLAESDRGGAAHRAVGSAPPRRPGPGPEVGARRHPRRGPRHVLHDGDRIARPAR